MNKKEVKSKESQEVKKKKRVQEEERISILLKADEILGQTLQVDLVGQMKVKNELDSLLQEPWDDPEAKYEMYYKVVRRLLIKYLPKGKAYEAPRKLIYEEINTYLTRGHRIRKDGTRGADGRMGYISDMRDLANVVNEWISNRETMFGLYTKICALNSSKGYGKGAQ